MTATTTEAATTATELYAKPNLSEVDYDVIGAAIRATRGWKRLPEFCDALYVRNYDGVLMVITDMRGYNDDTDPDFHGWHLAPLSAWVDVWMETGEWTLTFRTLNEARSYGEQFATGLRG